MHIRNNTWSEQQQKKNTIQYFDRENMQKMQDAFCESNRVYCLCVERNLSHITEFSGTAEEEAFIRKLVPAEVQQDWIDLFSDVEGESILAYGTENPYVMMRAVAIRRENNYLLGAWLVIGIDSDKLPEDSFVPSAIQRTTRDDFEKTIALLEVLTDSYFSNKNQLKNMSEDIAVWEEEEKHMEYLLQRTEILTDILKMMESNDSFSEVTADILAKTGKYIGVSNCHLLKLDVDDMGIDLVCEWSKDAAHNLSGRFESVKKTDFPFMTGRPYTISSDTVMPEPFLEYFAKYGIRCGVYLPVNISGKTGMYLCFVMMGEDRKWSVEDIKFFNDVKRVVQTILVKRVTKNSLASSYSALESILENTGCGVSVIDLHRNTILYTNETYKKMYLTETEQADLDGLLMSSQKMTDKVQEFHASDSAKWFEISFAQMHWVDGREVRLATIYDISKTKQYQAKIEYQASVDYLTGLFNRMRFEEDLSQEIHMTVRSGGRCAAMFIDLDDFDNINDGLGHQMGDALLKNVAQALQRMDGNSCTCYRIGGDEFVILVRNRQMDRMQSIIQNVQKIFARPWNLDGTGYYCTMSMGIVVIPKDGVETELLMQRADIALHAAKSLGKNRVEYYNNEQISSAVERLDLEKSMREAVERGCQEFEVYYQPLIDVTKPDKPCCGAEALVRWTSPTMGMVFPSQFIPLAEYLGLINEIGKHVLMEACKRCKYWNDFGHPEYKVNVNLSVVQLLQNDIVDTVRMALDSTGVNPSNLTLEVTEGLAVNDMKRMQQILGDIKAMGVRVALDDFGTGYSSLNHIRSMPIDVIKIDRCFVEDIGEDMFSDVFVRSVSQMADALDMHICVEGVEDEKQCEVLGNMNVDMIQGYLFDKPLSVEDFEKKYLF